MKKKTKDIILISILFLVLGLVYIIQISKNNENATSASIFFSGKELVIIDFETKEKPKLTTNQENLIYYRKEIEDSDNKYPEIIEINENVFQIKLLGYYKVNNEFNLVVIETNLLEKSVKIVKEESPYNICSKAGISYGKPLICIPNRLSVEFKIDGEGPGIII